MICALAEFDSKTFEAVLLIRRARADTPMRITKIVASVGSAPAHRMRGQNKLGGSASCSIDNCHPPSEANNNNSHFNIVPFVSFVMNSNGEYSFDSSTKQCKLGNQIFTTGS